MVGSGVWVLGSGQTKSVGECGVRCNFRRHVKWWMSRPRINRGYARHRHPTHRLTFRPRNAHFVRHASR